MQEKIEKLKIFNRRCSRIKMKMSGIKEKVTTVTKEEESNPHRMPVGTLRPDLPSQLILAR